MKSDSPLQGQRVSIGAFVYMLLATACITPREPVAEVTLPLPPTSHTIHTEKPQPTALQQANGPFYTRSISLAVSDESYQVGYRQNNFVRGGYWGLEFLSNEDDDIAFNGRIVRTGRVDGTPWRLGVGLGAYAAIFEDSDQELYAITLSAMAQYDFPTNPSTRAVFDISVAPDVTTFNDGDSLRDFVLRYEVDISGIAAAFVGGRYFDAETEFDEEFTRELQIGVRLGF